jgi:hypothetical protein
MMEEIPAESTPGLDEAKTENGGAVPAGLDETLS